MRIFNKLEIITVITLLSLAFGNQSAFSQNNGINPSKNLENLQQKTILTKIDNSDSVSSQNVITVNNSLISLPIPEPLGILCILGMAGISSFLKLKIAKIKHAKKSAEKIEETQITEITEESAQVFNR